MKKLFVVSLLVLNLPAFGLVTGTVENGCSTTANNMVAVFDPDDISCSSGTFLPANSSTCATCPTGYTCPGGTLEFDEKNAVGINAGQILKSSSAKTCSVNMTNADSNNVSTLHSLYEINRYMCQPGTFLPANTEGCQTCPTDAVCAGRTNAGGEFIFNPEDSQGIVINDRIHTGLAKACSTNYVFENGEQDFLTWHALFEIAGYDINVLNSSNNTGACDVAYRNSKADPNLTLTALFQINEYDCAPGTYLPANATVCATCSADFYCGGGTYTFNETTAQGINACDSGTHSPAGSSSSSQCVAGYTCTSGQYLPKNTTVCAACPNGYTCSGGTYNLDANNDQGIVANTITITWNGALQSDIEANNAGTCTYGGDIRTPVRADPAQIPAGKRFVGWVFRKTAQN